MVAVITLATALSYSQNGLSVRERLKVNIWQHPGSDVMEITFTDNTRLTIVHGSQTYQGICYYNLSEVPDSLFQAHKIGADENGRFINFIMREPFLANRLYLVRSFEILKLTENKMVIESQSNRQIIGRRTVRFVPKQD